VARLSFGVVKIARNAYMAKAVLIQRVTVGVVGLFLKKEYKTICLYYFLRSIVCVN
jgi:hypothetical protein